MKHKVISNRKLNYKFHLITLKAPVHNFSFKTGQFVVLRVSESVFRCYSIASLPDKLPLWQIFVDITPQGPGTRYLSKLKSGDMIEIVNVAGTFASHPEKSKQVIFAATGCGLAALKPIIENYTQKDNGIEMFLFWGLRYEKDIVFKNILESWRKKFPNFTYKIVLSQPNPEWKGEKGHITKQIVNLTEGKPTSETSIYLCGGSDFIEEAQGKLQAIEFPEERMHFERCY